MSSATMPPAPRTSLYSAEHNGISLRVEVQDDAVSFSEVPDIRTMPWEYALDWLHAQGYHVRKIPP